MSLLLKTLAFTVALAIQAQAQTYLTNGLVAYYPFNGNANDATGNGNDGTLVGGVSLATNRFGLTNQAYNFNGGGYIQIPNTPALDIADASPITISVWILKTGSGVMHILGKRDGCTAPIQFQMPCDDESVAFSGPQGSGAGAYITPTNWTQLVGECDGTNLLFFTNGVLSMITTNQILGDPASTGLEIGDSGTCAGFVGLLDDVRVYNRALTAAEVQQLYAYEAQQPINSMPQISLIQVVVPSFSNLIAGTNYQLQIAANLSGTFTNCGPVFTATNTTMIYPQYFNVANWSQLFFRLQIAP